MPNATYPGLDHFTTRLRDELLQAHRAHHQAPRPAPARRRPRWRPALVGTAAVLALGLLAAPAVREDSPAFAVDQLPGGELFVTVDTERTDPEALARRLRDKGIQVEIVTNVSVVTPRKELDGGLAIIGVKDPEPTAQPGRVPPPGAGTAGSGGPVLPDPFTVDPIEACRRQGSGVPLPPLGGEQLVRCELNVGVAYLECTQGYHDALRAVMPAAAEALRSACAKDDPARPFDPDRLQPDSRRSRANYLIDPDMLERRRLYLVKYTAR
jgi:hypothetical protein